MIARDLGQHGDMALLRLGPLSVPTPGEVVGSARAVGAWAGEVVAVGAGLPRRVDDLLDEVTRLLALLAALAERADGLVGRAETVVVGVEEVIGQARVITDGASEVVSTSRTITEGASEVVSTSRSITEGASEVVTSSRAITEGAQQVVESSRTITTGASELLEGAGATSRSAQELLGLYQPLLERGAPLADRFVSELSREEVESAIKLVDQMPQFTEHMVTDIMPILATLDRVGPDLAELLSVTKDLRQGIAGIPGLSYLVKRGAAKDDEN